MRIWSFLRYAMFVPSKERRAVIARSRIRHESRPDLECLPDRCLLSVVAMNSATETNFDTVTIDYEIGSSRLSALTVEVYRSSTPGLGAGNQLEIGALNLSGAELTPGMHDNVPLVLGNRSPGVNALAIDPAHPYVIAAATGPDGTTTSASFQTITIGLVTHGFNPSNTAPTWIYQMAASLKGVGYNDVIPFAWAKEAYYIIRALAFII